MAPREHNLDAKNSKKSVDDILRSLIPGSKPSSFGAAHQETSHGLRKKNSSTTKKGRNKNNAKKKEDDSEGWFKVLTVGVITDGVDIEENGNLLLVNDHAPDRHNIQMLVHQKLAHIDESGIPFGLSWTFEQVDEKLRQLFPELFEFIDSTLPVYDLDLHNKPLSPWLLCFRKRQILKIVPDMFPTGHVLEFNSATTRAGYRQCQIVIVQGRVSAGSSSRLNKKHGRVRSDDDSSDDSLAEDSDLPPQQKTRSRTVTRSAMISSENCINNTEKSAEDEPAGVSGGTGGLAILPGTAAEAITSAFEPNIAGSSTAPILIDIPLNHNGTMGLGSPPSFWEDLATLTPPLNAILQTVTPPPSTSVPDPTFSFSPQMASQNPWQADRTFEF